jgi:putative serine protease PepD
MTDETRPDEGRTPSGFPEPQGRPVFLPADEQAERPGGSPEPTPWGDPSGRPADTWVYGTPQNSYGPQEPSGARSYGPQETSGPRSYGSQEPSGAHSYGAQEPSGGTRPHESPYFGDSPGAPPYGTNPAGPPPYADSGRYGPPPPRNALGMGAGWGPPPPTGPQGFGAGGVPPRRRGPATGMLIVLAVVIALVASSLGSVGTYLLTRSGSGTDPSYSLGPVPTTATNRAPDSVAGVASRVLPSVVSLEVGNTGNTEGATGSGFLIKDGYVLTNNHVVAMAAKGGEIQIMFNNRKTTTGRIVGRDPGSDLAVVKPEETFGTPQITLGNSDQVVVGDPVIAIGSPLGLTGTVTTGIVSSLNRPVIAGDETGTSTEEPAYISAIQTDAAINPGNSGGPLVNGRGEVVGVNSAIATLSRSMTSQSGSIGLGFAIPVNQARRVAQELVTTGKAKRPKIGVVIDPDYKGQGVRIASSASGGRQPVDTGGPAAKAGLKAGDVILEMDGLALQDGNELIALVRSKAPGSKVTIKYTRGGDERTATVTVEADDEPAPSPS